jgi:pimeloyl-ACP methyl ester carboxylesterase
MNTMSDKIYFISGLSADKRVFVNLKIDHPFQKHIEWETPNKKESLPEYSKRLIEQIDLNSEVILIGVSFGGIIAQEISKIISVKKLIIISSIKNKNEMDWKLQWVSKTNIYKLFSPEVLKFLNKITADYFFGIKSKEENKLLKQIIEDTDTVFSEWAIDRLMKWDNKTSTSFLLHIHGTKDRIFPIDKIKSAVLIENGGHLMILNKADQISLLINQYLK